MVTLKGFIGFKLCEKNYVGVESFRTQTVYIEMSFRKKIKLLKIVKFILNQLYSKMLLFTANPKAYFLKIIGDMISCLFFNV